MRDSGKRNTIKSHIKALGLYNFIRGVGWAYKRGGGGGGWGGGGAGGGGYFGGVI